MILLAQMTSDNYWSDFGEEWAEREDGDVYFGDLIDYQENRFFETQKVKELKEKYASKLKNMIFDENGYKEYDLKNDFMKINLEWRGEKGVLDSIYNEMKGIFASPQLELFYYYGFKWMGADRFDFESFSDGEQKFIKLMSKLQRIR